MSEDRERENGPVQPQSEEKLDNPTGETTINSTEVDVCAESPRQPEEDPMIEGQSRVVSTPENPIEPAKARVNGQSPTPPVTDPIDAAEQLGIPSGDVVMESVEVDKKATAEEDGVREGWQHQIPETGADGWIVFCPSDEDSDTGEPVINAVEVLGIFPDYGVSHVKIKGKGRNYYPPLSSTFALKEEAERLVSDILTDREQRKEAHMLRRSRATRKRMRFNHLVTINPGLVLRREIEDVPPEAAETIEQPAEKAAAPPKQRKQHHKRAKKPKDEKPGKTEQNGEGGASKSETQDVKMTDESETKQARPESPSPSTQPAESKPVESVNPQDAKIETAAGKKAEKKERKQKEKKEKKEKKEPKEPKKRGPKPKNIVSKPLKDAEKKAAKRAAKGTAKPAAASTAGQAEAKIDVDLAQLKLPSPPKPKIPQFTIKTIDVDVDRRISTSASDSSSESESESDESSSSGSSSSSSSSSSASTSSSSASSSSASTVPNKQTRPVQRPVSRPSNVPPKPVTPKALGSQHQVAKPRPQVPMGSHRLSSSMPTTQVVRKPVPAPNLRYVVPATTPKPSPYPPYAPPRQFYPNSSQPMGNRPIPPVTRAPVAIPVVQRPDIRNLPRLQDGRAPINTGSGKRDSQSQGTSSGILHSPVPKHGSAPQSKEPTRMTAIAKWESMKETPSAQPHSQPEVLYSLLRPKNAPADAFKSLKNLPRSGNGPLRLPKEGDGSSDAPIVVPESSAYWTADKLKEWDENRDDPSSLVVREAPVPNVLSVPSTQSSIPRDPREGIMETKPRTTFVERVPPIQWDTPEQPHQTLPAPPVFTHPPASYPLNQPFSPPAAPAFAMPGGGGFPFPTPGGPALIPSMSNMAMFQYDSPEPGPGPAAPMAIQPNPNGIPGLGPSSAPTIPPQTSLPLQQPPVPAAADPRLSANVAPDTTPAQTSSAVVSGEAPDEMDDITADFNKWVSTRNKHKKKAT